MTTIKLKNGSGAPLAGDLVVGEPALDLTNKRLYTEDSGGTVIEVGTNPTSVTTGAITATGIDVTGTVTADGLKVETSTTSAITISEDTGSGTAELRFVATDSFPKTKIVTDVSAGSLTLETLASDRLSIANNGDISFYEDTGTTAKFFWDASAESLGIGNTSPSEALDVSNSIAVGLNIKGTGANTTLYNPSGDMFVRGGTGSKLSLGANNTNDLMVLNSSGNVGIGTSNPAQALVVSRSSGNTYLDVSRATQSQGQVALQLTGGTGGTNWIMYQDTSSDDLRFFGNSSTRMTITSSGNLLVGRSTAGSGTGFEVNNAFGGYILSTSTGIAGVFDRLSTDGEILQFRKDGTSVGSIGTSGGTIYAGKGGSGLIFNDGGTKDLIPYSLTAVDTVDDSISLGIGSKRFKNLYLSGGVISGSAVSTYKNTFAFDGASINGIAVNNTTGSGTPAHIAFFHNGTGVGSINCTASATAYNTSSDYRLKENVTSMTGATTRLKQLAPKRFNFIADADTTVDGFLAHEVADVVPEAITGTKDGMRDEEYEITPAVYEDVVIPAVLDEEGNEVEAERTEQQLVSEAVMGTRSVPDYQGIDQSKLVPLLVATIQELEARITALESN